MKWANISANCGNGKRWFAFSDGNNGGILSAQLNSSGIGRLAYGNCGNEGLIRVYLGGVKIGEAKPDTHNNILEFPFTNGSKLELTDVGGNSVIEISSFSIAYCNTWSGRYALE